MCGPKHVIFSLHFFLYIYINVCVCVSYLYPFCFLIISLSFSCVFPICFSICCMFLLLIFSSNAVFHVPGFSRQHVGFLFGHLHYVSYVFMIYLLVFLEMTKNTKTWRKIGKVQETIACRRWLR